MQQVLYGIAFWFMVGLIAIALPVPSVSSLTISTPSKGELEFAVEANKGWHINDEAPWNLKLDGVRYSRFKNGKIKVDKPKTVDAEYILNAYMCNEAKTECRPETFMGKVSI